MLDTFFFYAFALMALAGAVLTITLRNAVHCAISLIASLAGVAGLYLLQQAEFLFATQIVLYIGGIMLLFLFVIMLVNLESAAKERQFHRHWLAGVAAVGGSALLIGYFFTKGLPALQLGAPVGSTAVIDPLNDGNVQRIADQLFREYLVPFEVASLLLLVAIVGSVIMARRKA